MISPMKVLKVRVNPPYEILINSGLLDKICEDLPATLDFGKVALITDSKVKELYGIRLLESLRGAGLKAEIFDFPEGEASKNINTVINLARALINKGFDRKDLILALGGGVVGDVAGFLASIYLRGVPYVQVPTTLLAQVDSSIGGKTGIDLPEGKNLLGTFYQPRKVYIDLDVLQSLPVMEIKNGLAEIIKYGCILKKKIFKLLQRRAKLVYHLDKELFQELIYQSCATKAFVVTKDERESGLRRVLNFGHTLGHALEALSNYTIPHGLAVAVGMTIEAKLAEILRVNEEPLYVPIVNLLSSLEMPYRISHLNLSLNKEEILEAIKRDKKIWKGILTIVLLKKIGEYTFYENPAPEAIERAIMECM